MLQPVDPASTIGKAPRPEAHFPLVVVGAGPAGLAAALAAARNGIATLLVDENPIDPEQIAIDVPLHFGQRAAVGGSKGRNIEQMLESNPGLVEAFEAGIDVQLGVAAWAVYLNGETVHSLDRPLIGLADETRSWMVSFDRLIVAAGARDLGFAFPGWEKPGVMGALAAMRLIERYNAFNGRRLLILGAGALGARVAEVALAAGLEVAGMVDVDGVPFGEGLPDGVPLFARHAIVRASGTAEVDGAVIVALDADGRAEPDGVRNVACDTIVLAVGAVPNIELVSCAGARTRFASTLGGHVPATGEGGKTSLPVIFVAGDCCGVHAARLRDERLAAADGEAAARAVARSLGIETETAPPVPAGAEPDPEIDQYAVLQRWMEVHGRLGSNDTIVCLCEEVTRAEILGVKPPRYLGCTSEGVARRDIGTLADDGPINQDQIKRLTRAGMGPCQGRRCREQVQVLIASATGVSPAEVPLASYRPPVRPLPLDVFAVTDESEAMRDNWVAWFNIPSQWTPHWLPAEMPDDGVAKKIVSGK